MIRQAVQKKSSFRIWLRKMLFKVTQDEIKQPTGSGKILKVGPKDE